VSQDQARHAHTRGGGDFCESCFPLLCPDSGALLFKSGGKPREQPGRTVTYGIQCLHYCNVKILGKAVVHPVDLVTEVVIVMRSQTAPPCHGQGTVQPQDPTLISWCLLAVVYCHAHGRVFADSK
jgi:hypothetical protein